MRISDWSSDVCSSDLFNRGGREHVDQREAHIGAAQILHHHTEQCKRKALSAKVFRPIDGAPAIFDESLIGFAESFGHGDCAAIPLFALELGPASLRERVWKYV